MTQKKRRVLTGGRVVDPASGIDELRDVCIDGKEIVLFGDHPPAVLPDRLKLFPSVL